MRVGFILILSLCGVHSRAQMDPSQATEIIEDFVAAFNEHDVEAMAGMISEDLIYMFVTDDKIAVETRGKDAFRKAMLAYYKQIPSARSETESIMTAGNFVTVRERAHWKSSKGARSQMSLAVYQLKDNTIHRVWYYPVQR